MNVSVQKLPNALVAISLYSDYFLPSSPHCCMSPKQGVRNLQEAGMDKLQQRSPDNIKLLQKHLKNGTNLLNILIVVLDGKL